MADESEAHKGGTKPQIAIYQRIASREDEIVDTLFELLKSRNEAVAVSAAKTLLAKILPDRKAVEVTGENGEPIKLNIISGADYVSAIGNLASTSTSGAIYGPTEIQGSSMAQTSEEDDNSDKSDSKVDTA